MSLNLESLWGLIGVSTQDELPVVLIDGGSGAGKSTFAANLANAAPSETRVVSMDDFYPGWDGLADGVKIVEDHLLVDEDPGYQEWNWKKNEAGSWVPVSFGQPVIIEGCGSITPKTVELSTYSIWLEVDAPIRKKRAIARNGAGYEQFWGRWEKQEKQHWSQHRPWTLADLVLRA